MSNVVRFGLTPKMKPVSPKRAAVVAGLDIGTSKIVCMIARLQPQAPQDVLRRRSHGVRVLGFAHTAASGMKGKTPCSSFPSGVTAPFRRPDLQYQSGSFAAGHGE
ncbi:MAG TPA: hypothetical protein VF498_09480 [Anaerolineales bacterium]